MKYNYKSSWKTYKIEEISEKVGIGPFGSSIKVDTFVEQGIPVISGQHLRGARLEDNEYNFIMLEHADKLKNANVFRGDVIFTHAGNIGQVAYIPDTSRYERYILSQRQFYMRCDKTKVMPEFVTYYFKTYEGQHKLLSNRSQSGVPSIAQPVTYLRSIEIPVPPLSVQQGICKIISDLEDKIELNQKMKKTLEAIAQAVFRKLFSRNYDSNDTIRLEEIIEFDPKIPLQKGKEFLYLDMAGLSTEGMTIDNVIHKKFMGGSKFQNGDTLLARITPCLENGKTAYVNFLSNEEHTGFGSTEFIVMRAKPWISPQFVYCLARDPEFRSFSIKSMIGSSGRQRVQRSMLESYKIIKPSRSIMDKFHKITEPIFYRIKDIWRESITLKEIRDSLLPRLMSEKIRLGLQ